MPLLCMHACARKRKEGCMQWLESRHARTLHTQVRQGLKEFSKWPTYPQVSCPSPLTSLPGPSVHVMLSQRSPQSRLSSDK